LFKNFLKYFFKFFFHGQRRALQFVVFKKVKVVFLVSSFVVNPLYDKEKLNNCLSSIISLKRRKIFFSFVTFIIDISLNMFRELLCKLSIILNVSSRYPMWAILNVEDKCLFSLFNTSLHCMTTKGYLRGIKLILRSA